MTARGESCPLCGCDLECRGCYCHDDPDDKSYQAGAAAERQRLAAVISPAQFRKLADWFDIDDQFKEAMFPETWSPGSRKDDVQQDLRRFAGLLDGEPHDQPLPSAPAPPGRNP